jgi:hypothetical protein
MDRSRPGPRRKAEMRYYLALACLVIATEAASEPLAEMKLLVQSCEQWHNNERAPFEVALLPGTGKPEWVKRQYSPTIIQYDVRKTDSLVSPFSAYIDLSNEVKAGRGATEDEARALDVSGAKAIRTARRIRFAYQESKWVLTGGNFKINDSEAMEASVDSIRKLPLAGRCLP